MIKAAFAYTNLAAADGAGVTAATAMVDHPIGKLTDGMISQRCWLHYHTGTIYIDLGSGTPSWGLVALLGTNLDSNLDVSLEATNDASWATVAYGPVDLPVSPAGQQGNRWLYLAADRSERYLRLVISEAAGGSDFPYNAKIGQLLIASPLRLATNFSQSYAVQDMAGANVVRTAYGVTRAYGLYGPIQQWQIPFSYYPRADHEKLLTMWRAVDGPCNGLLFIPDPDDSGRLALWCRAAENLQSQFDYWQLHDMGNLALPLIEEPMSDEVSIIPDSLWFALGVNNNIPYDLVTGRPVNCARATTAWAWCSDGLLREVAANTPVIEWLDSAEWLRAEQQSQNVISYSKAFDNSWWYKARSDIHGTPVTAPDGTVTGSGLIATAVENTHYAMSNYIAVTEGEAWTLSVFAQKALQAWAKLIILQYDSTYAFKATTASDYFELDLAAWDRFSISGIISDTTPDTAFVRVAIYIAEADGDDSFTGDGTDPEINIWEAQFEKQPVSTSLTPTSGTPVTRLADLNSCDLTPDLDAALGDTWTMALKFQVPYDFADMPNDAYIPLVSVNQSSDYLIAYQKTAGGVGQLIVNDGTNTATIGLEVAADTAYTVAAQGVAGSSLRIGYDATWGTDAGAHVKPATNTLYLMPSVDLPAYIGAFQAWGKTISGNPSACLVDW